jgi:hypothetical protein
MSAVIIKTTQSSQVARALESQIGSGHFSPGRKMPSTRELARRFEVSQQVVKSALDVLARRSLIVRKPRVGIFVNAKSVVGRREYSLLSHRRIDNPDLPDYTSQVLSVSDYELWQDINLSTRLISKVTPEIVRYELDKIQAVRPNCLLTQMVTRETMGLYKDLPFPVVVIGDTEQELDGQARPENQIVENTGERAAFMVEAAAAAGCRRIAVVGGGDPERSWGKKLKQGALAKAAELGVDCRYVWHLIGGHDETVRAAMAGTPADAVVIDGFRNIGSFVQKLQDAGHQPGRDIKIFTNGEMYPGTTFVKNDYHDFSRAVLERLDALVKDPSLAFGRIELSGLVRHRVIPLE